MTRLNYLLPADEQQIFLQEVFTVFLLSFIHRLFVSNQTTNRKVKLMMLVVAN